MTDPVQQTVEDVMTREVVTLGPDASFREAVRLLRQARVDALPVVEDGKVVGIVTESDLLLKEERVGELGSVAGTPWQRRRDRQRAGARSVREAMTRHPATVRPTDTLTAAARILHRRRVGGLPVVEDDARLVGIVTRSDLLTVFLRDDEQLEADVARALASCDPSAVSWRVEDGCVTLEGEVGLRSEALRVAARTSHVPGVVQVACLIRAKVDDVDVVVAGA